MQKLYSGKGKKIHPSPAPSSPCELLLAVLPAAILTLAAALSAEEKEVLAYLLSGGAMAGQGKVAVKKNAHHHPPELGCGCFGCYKSFWARWDKSPNRHLIHHILDAVEESVEPVPHPSSRRRRRRFNCNKDFKEEGFLSAEEKARSAEEDGNVEGFEEEDYREIEKEEEKNHDAEAVAGVNSPSTVRRFMSFIGDRLWGIWNE